MGSDTLEAKKCKGNLSLAATAPYPGVEYELSTSKFLETRNKKTVGM